MVTTQEQHDQFANGLLLLLPDFTPHELTPQRNIVPEVIGAARLGSYADCKFNNTYDGEPRAFFAPAYFLHLRPAIIELWRAVYLPK